MERKLRPTFSWRSVRLAACVGADGDRNRRDGGRHDSARPQTRAEWFRQVRFLKANSVHGSSGRLSRDGSESRLWTVVSRVRDTGRRVWLVALATPGLRVILLAIRNYVVHQSANLAGSLAFSSVLAMFPLLILVSASAGFVGQPGDAAALANRVMDYAPQLVRDTMQPVIDQVLAQRNRALLAVGVLATLWTASSGMQAIRSALNRAYGIERGHPFWKARIKVTLFTIVVGTGVVAAFSSVVVMPYVWQLLRANADVGHDTFWLQNGVRYGLAFLVLMMLYALLYGWLPDIRQRLYTVMPGALVGAALWVVAAATLSYTLHSAGKLALLYGSFAGVVAMLVFLYISATTLIFGAEINGVLRETVPPPKRAPSG
jgi:membrane protein